MPQIFPSNANLLARYTILFAGLVLAAIVMVGANVTPYTHRLGVAPDQPVAFSHKHHVGELGLDCRYCHQTVEKTGFAGMPPTETCYTCHSKIWTNSPLLEPIRESFRTGKPIQWQRVNRAPDFVYFDHSIHIKKGIGCISCHGRVDEMNYTYKPKALEMLFCLDCHRRPEKNVMPLKEVFDLKYQAPKNQEDLGAELVKKYGIQKEQLTNCSVCHK